MQTRALLKKTDGTFRTILILMLLGWSSVLSAAIVGAGTKENPYVFENGTTYKVEAFTGFYGKFTAPTDGKLTISKTNYAVYTDGTFSTIDESIIPVFSGSFESKAYTIYCTAGKTYYVGNNYVMDPVEFTFTFGTGAMPLELVEVSPVAGTVFDMGRGLLELTFNQTPAVASVTMDAGGAKGVSLVKNGTGAYISVDVKTTLQELYEAGRLKEGDDIKFTLSGVAPASDPEALYNNTGIIEIAYKAGPKLLTLVGSSNTPIGDPAARTFYSYYMTGSDAGVISLTFSGDINMSDGMKPIARLTYGEMEGDDFYTEPIEVHAQGGNTIVLDVRGKLRRAKDMLASGAKYTDITLQVSNIRDMAGNYVYSDGSGSLGSFGFLYDYKEVEYTLLTDWALIGGGNVIDATTTAIELWMREEGGYASFSGAALTYTDGGVERTHEVKLSEMTVTDDGYGERTVTIPMPAISADAGTTVTVTLTGVERPDGLTTGVDSEGKDHLSKTFNTVIPDVDSIDAITAAADGSVSVSTADGRMLLRDADAAALRTLAKGLYIINGKKMIIR